MNTVVCLGNGPSRPKIKDVREVAPPRSTVVACNRFGAEAGADIVAITDLPEAEHLLASGLSKFRAILFNAPIPGWLEAGGETAERSYLNTGISVITYCCEVLKPKRLILWGFDGTTGRVPPIYIQRPIRGFTGETWVVTDRDGPLNEVSDRVLTPEEYLEWTRSFASGTAPAAGASKTPEKPAPKPSRSAATGSRGKATPTSESPETAASSTNSGKGKTKKSAAGSSGKTRKTGRATKAGKASTRSRRKATGTTSKGGSASKSSGKKSSSTRGSAGRRGGSRSK